MCRKTVRPIKFNVTAITFQLRCQPCGIVRATGFSSFSRSAAGRTVLPHAITMRCVFCVVCTFAVPTKVRTVNQCRDTGQPIIMLLMFYQLYYVRCLIVLRIFKQDNASGCLDNDQLVALWPLHTHMHPQPPLPVDATTPLKSLLWTTLS